jgi:cytochrome c-type biogenesis protein CcmF
MLLGDFMAGFGFFALLMALFFGVAAIGLYTFAIFGKENPHRYFKLAGWALLAQLGFTVIASIILLVALIAGKYEIAYVAGHIDNSLPMIYKISAFWAGKAGSLLFWGLCLAAIAAIESFRIRKLEIKYQSVVLMTIVINTTFFILSWSFITPLFEALSPIPRDGSGMNPTLQTISMLIHPPVIFIGFAGFVVPFGHALASLFTKNLSSDWVKNSRQWTLFTWVFLAAGIIIGCWWAYAEFSWGGYWSWDPVTNASLFPWLTATAMIHAMIMYERRDTLKKLTYFMTLTTYMLTMFATFLTRSGIISDSVHAFSESHLGPFFAILMLIAFVIFLVAYVPNIKMLKHQKEFNFISKEGIFFMGILILCMLTVAIWFYTMLPILSGLATGTKFTVGLSAYNDTAIPIFAALLFLTALGPIISYGSTAINKLAKDFLPIGIFGVVVTAITIIMGFTNPIGIILTLVTSFSLAAFVMWTFTIIKNGGPKQILHNRRAFGAIIVHIGVVMMSYGIIFSSLYSREMDVIAAPHSTIQFERYTIHVDTVYSERVANYISNFIPLHVFVGDRYLATLAPELRQYDQDIRQGRDTFFSEVSYFSMARGDLYVFTSGYNMPENQIRLTFKIQPLMIWIWIGSTLLYIGGLYGMTQNATITGPFPVARKEDAVKEKKKKK